MSYSFFWVIPRRMNFMFRRFGTLFHLHTWCKQELMEQRGSKRRHIEFRRRGITRGELSYLTPLGSENISAPYFKQCFFRGGVITPQTVKHHASLSQDRNNKYFILYIEFVAADLLFRLARTRHAWKGDCYLTVLMFHGRYYFYSLKFTLMFINERKRNGNTYLISNFDSLEAAPSNLPR